MRGRYQSASSRHEQFRITQEVVAEIRNNHGWFLRFDEKQRGWIPIDEAVARKKVAQAIQYIRRRTSRKGESYETQCNESRPKRLPDQQGLSYCVIPEDTKSALAPSTANTRIPHESVDTSDTELFSDEQISQALGISIEPHHTTANVDKSGTSKEDEVQIEMDFK